MILRTRKDKCLKANASSPPAQTDDNTQVSSATTTREKKTLPQAGQRGSEINTTMPPASSVSRRKDGKPTPGCAPPGSDPRRPSPPGGRRHVAGDGGFPAAPPRQRQTLAAPRIVPAEGAAGRSVPQPPAPELLGDIPTPDPHTLSYWGSRGAARSRGRRPPLPPLRLPPPGGRDAQVVGSGAGPRRSRSRGKASRRVRRHGRGDPVLRLPSPGRV